MRALVIALSALAAIPATAFAQAPTLSISPGETVVARVDEAGFVEVSREASDKAPESPPVGGTVRFIFTAIGDTRFLHVQNGYDRAFDYRARMFAGRQSAQTSICTVMPRIASIENWQQPIDRLELSDPRLSDQSEMTCR